MGKICIELGSISVFNVCAVRFFFDYWLCPNFVQSNDQIIKSNQKQNVGL